MAIEFTKDQQKAIGAKGTVLVAAAAGSGKTAVLTERVIRRICDPNDPASIDRMLIVTFTNASALEMRVRIGKKLDEYCSEHPNDSAALKQKMLLRSAKICTIDSFCGDLVRKYFGQLGINPDFTVATDAQTSALKEKALKDVLAKHFAVPSADFNHLCETFSIYDGDSNIKDAILSIYDFSLCMSRPEHWLKTSVNHYFPEKINSSVFADVIYKNAKRKLLSSRESAEFILRECVGTEFEDAWFKGFSDTVEYINEMLSVSASKNWNRLYDLSINFEKTDVKTVRKAENTNLRDVMKVIRERIYKDVQSVSAEMCGTEQEALDGLNTTGALVGCLVELVNEFSSKYLELLLSKNLLTFGLIEQFALKLLCVETEEGLVPSELSRDVCKLYDEVLVDEYQDNNDLQDSLFFAVSDSGKHLFMVGDVKQSIYGFRNANPDNFLRHKDTYSDFDGETSPSKVILKSNFRSRSGVCGFVNGIFKVLMHQDTSNMDYGTDEMLDPGASYPDSSAFKAEVNIVTNSGSGADRDIADAESVADYIVSVMNEDAFLKNGDTELRKAEFKDFAILLRSPRKRVKYYIDALRKRGIPAAFDSGEFFTAPEILTAMSILRVIDNPLHDIPLLSAMTSVAFGFTFDDVAKIKSNFSGNNLYQRVIKSSLNGDIKAQKLLETVSQLRKRAATMSVASLINVVYRVTCLQEIFSSFDDGIQKKANLVSLLSMASDFDGFSDGGLSGFITHFEHSAAEKSSSSKSVGGSVNAVKIMSFHGSKGLQFPVCIVAGCGNGFNKTDLNKQIITNGKYGIGMSFVDSGIKYNTVAKNVLKSAYTSKMISEEIRLLYVAMTRAEERLMLSISCNDFKKDVRDGVASLGLSAYDSNKIPAEKVLCSDGYKPMLLCSLLMQKDGDKLCEAVNLPALGFKNEGEFKLSVATSYVYSGVKVSSETSTDSVVVNPEIIDMLNERFEYEYPFKDECITPSKMAVTKLVHGDARQFAFNARPRFLSKAGLTPAERGTALHKFMQFANFEYAEKDADAEVKRLYEFEFISEQEADSIDRNLLNKFFKSNLYNRIKNADKLWREYKFMVNYPYNDQQTIVQGIADCMFEENGKLIIVDFKTDNVKDMTVLSDRYSQQLAIYKDALSEIFEKNVSECIIYSMTLSDGINV